jgi:inner membrane protein
MDNVCHTLLGVAVARAGLQRTTSLATTTAALASNLPDIDVLVFTTSVPSVAFRRGITHGVPAQILLPLAFAGLMWWIARRRPAHAPKPRFDALLVISYIGVLSHVFLDYLNTYGVRLLSPVSGQWFYGDAAFIVDIWLWLMFGVGAWLAGGTRRPTHVGDRPGTTRPAIVALVCASIYIGAMLWSARVARTIVRDAWTARTGEPPHALMVGPVPLNPFRRNIIIDAGDRYFTGRFEWLPVRVAFGEEATLKNDWLRAVVHARQNARVQGIMIWARFPVWEARDVPGGTEVHLRDMRFRGLDRGGFAATVTVPR